MPKIIAVCSDGTGNTAIKGRGTNVFKIFEAIDVNSWRDPDAVGSTPRTIEQVAIYDDGVGTGPFLLWRLVSGAFGIGLARNVKRLYRELIRVHEAGDRIFFFGFSRGAFTVRTLAGLVDTCGIPAIGLCESEEDLERIVKRAYGVHRVRFATKPVRWVASRIGRPINYDKSKATFLENSKNYVKLTEDEKRIEESVIAFWDHYDQGLRERAKAQVLQEPTPDEADDPTSESQREPAYRGNCSAVCGGDEAGIASVA